MTRMSCGRVEELMPLYAAGDLPAGRRARAVESHVAACGACAALAAEFRASREWVLEADAVPEFGEEFYERLRAGVLDRVNRDTRPAAPSRLWPFFAAPFAGRRLAFAASLAAAACALALALYFFADGGRHVQNEIVHAPPAGELISPPQRAHDAPRPGEVTGEQQPSQDTPRGDEWPAPRNPKRAGGTFKRTPTLRHPAPAPPAAAREFTAAMTGTRPEVAGTRAETAGVARIEIQTADPTIRIIWLAPSSGDEEAAPDQVNPNR